jgi:hypothetical protein
MILIYGFNEGIFKHVGGFLMDINAAFDRLALAGNGCESCG